MSACSHKPHAESAGRADSPLPVVELQKDYPHQDVDVHDLADVTYIPLETTDESLIGSCTGFHFCNDTIIIEDLKQEKVLLFNTKGKYLSSFRHIGNGGTEYTALGSMCVDPEAHEIFIADGLRPGRFVVYDFKGRFVRELMADKELSTFRIFNYSRDSLLVYDIKDLYKTSFGEKISSYPYYVISKQDGKTTPIPLWVENRKNNSFTIRVEESQTYYSTALGVCAPLVNSPQGIVIADYAKDTVYLYAGHRLKPLFVRHAKEDHPGLLSGVLQYNETFSLIGIADTYIENNEIESEKNTLLMLNHADGQIHEISLTNSDIPADEKWVRYDVGNSQLPPDVLVVLKYSADKLLEEYYMDGLSGRLKEIAARLSEEDNPVLMVAKQKEE